MQFERSTGKPFVHHWIHTGLVRMDGEKMSKSLGNMAFTADLLQRYSSDALRLYLLDRPYREDWDYRELDIRVADSLAKELSGKLIDEKEIPLEEIVRTAREFIHALQGGFDTVRAIRSLAATADSEDPGERPAARTLVVRVLGLTLGHDRSLV